MIFDNSVQLDRINTFLLDLGVSTIGDYEFIITDTDITGAYIYARACDNLDVITYVEKHPFFLANKSQNIHLSSLLRELSPLLGYSIALDIKFNRIKIYITQKAHTAIIQKYLFSIIPSPILETTGDFWMLSIDFSYRNPGWKIYWRVPIKQYLNLLPKDHENYIEHILIKEDISKILPGRNKKIYFKYSGLPNDDFFKENFLL